MNPQDRQTVIEARMAAYEKPDVEVLDAIGGRIGYGRAQQILGELWDAMLQKGWGISPGRGEMGVTVDDDLPPIPKAQTLRRQQRSNGGYEMVPAYSVAELKAFGRAAIALLRADGWQPIETAPKDGTHILLGVGNDGAEPIVAEGYAEFAGEEAMHDAFNSSDTLAVCLKLEHDAAPAAQPDPDDEAPECNVCGKPVAYGERHYRCGSAVMPAAQPGVQPVAWRKQFANEGDPNLYWVIKSGKNAPKDGDAWEPLYPSPVAQQPIQKEYRKAIHFGGNLPVAPPAAQQPARPEPRQQGTWTSDGRGDVWTPKSPQQVPAVSTQSTHPQDMSNSNEKIDISSTAVAPDEWFPWSAKAYSLPPETKMTIRLRNGDEYETIAGHLTQQDDEDAAALGAQTAKPEEGQDADQA